MDTFLALTERHGTARVQKNKIKLVKAQEIRAALPLEAAVPPVVLGFNHEVGSAPPTYNTPAYIKFAHSGAMHG